MKYKYFIISFFLSLFIPTICANRLGEDWLMENLVETRIFSHNKEYQGGTYNGSYELGVYHGHAEYTYYETPSFNRIYHGKFEFTGECTAKGYFYENKQVGKWYIYIPDVVEAYIDFGYHGEYDGDFQIETKNDNYSGEFKNGILHYCKYYNNYGTKSGNGYYDIDGLNPIGEWRVRDPNTSYKHFNDLIISYDNTGRLIKSGNRNNQTGDWENDYSDLPQVIATEVRTIIGNICLRETPAPKYTKTSKTYRLY